MPEKCECPFLNEKFREDFFNKILNGIINKKADADFFPEVIVYDSIRGKRGNYVLINLDDLSTSVSEKMIFKVFLDKGLKGDY